jgi:hypothetical protein
MINPGVGLHTAGAMINIRQSLAARLASTSCSLTHSLTHTHTNTHTHTHTHKTHTHKRIKREKKEGRNLSTDGAWGRGEVSHLTCVLTQMHLCYTISNWTG